MPFAPSRAEQGVFPITTMISGESDLATNAETQLLRETIANVRERNGLSSAPLDYRPELWEEEEQLQLFPLQ